MRIRATRIRAALFAGCATLCLALTLLSAGAAQAQTDGSSYNPASQAHWGACSRTTLNVAEAVSDLQANGVLGQYAQLIGVQASPAQMRKALTVVTVAAPTVTANHGCTDTGLVFGVGPRRLYKGETVGVALPATVRAQLCSGSHIGCERRVVKVHTVFPTNCWNIDSGTISVVVYVRRPKVKPKPVKKPPKVKAEPAVAKPSATEAVSCSAGGIVVTLANAAAATASAEFEVDGKRYGPLAPGQHMQVTVTLADGASATLTVSSNGHALIDHRSITDGCTAPAPQPAATAAMSCSAGGVVVTLSNAASAAADASFTVDGTSYGPIAAGASQTVTVALTFGATVQVTVTSGGQTLIAAQSFTDTCAAAPHAAVTFGCDLEGDDVGVVPADSGYPGGGAVTVVLSNGASATLPASFVVTATGNTVSGFGPTTFGPIAPGASLSEYIPVDATGNDVTVTVSSGGTTLYSNVFIDGCQGEG